MTENQKMRCQAIIHAASVSSAAVGAGLAQFSGSDNMIITPIQLGMVISLGEVFGITVSQSAAEAAVASGAAATIGRTASQVLVGWLPGLGNAVNAATAFGLTEALGWMVAKDYSKQAEEDGEEGSEPEEGL